jgi:uncharacterized phiE125 gp8 family phage protein
MTEPISLDEAKLQLRAESTTVDDTFIEELITTAREHVEQYCSIRLIVGAAAMTFACFAALERLTLAPVTAVTELRYLDAAGVEQVLDQTTYELFDVDADVLRPRIRLAYGKAWPALRSAEDAVRVTVTAGYAAVPKPIILAMKRLITLWYDNRGPVFGPDGELPHDVSSLLVNYRR